MIRKLLASKRGASSVLVILLLLVLVVFGVAALTTSLSGLRLGQKVSDWTTAYYGIEGIAAHHWANIDAAVNQASQQEADAYEQTLMNKLAELGFKTQLVKNGDAFYISYEVWEGKTGLHVTLEIAMDGSGLHPVEWYQIKQ